MDNARLQSHYFGFYRVLLRYRRTSIAGWLIVVVACVSVPFGWNLGRSTGFIEIMLTVITIVAGLTVVWQNISWLDEYLRIQFHTVSTEEKSEEPLITDIRNIMSEVENGGWQDAHEAIGKLRQLQSKYDLPGLET